MNEKQWIDEGESRETDEEIMEAIWYTAGGYEARARRIWEAPSDTELIAIWERVTGNGLRPADDFCWGAAGDQWAAGMD